MKLKNFGMIARNPTTIQKQNQGRPERLRFKATQSKKMHDAEGTVPKK
jgi:hypothetical protein